MQKFSDYHLWELSINGDQDAFAEIYNRYVDQLLEYGLRIVLEEDLVKDRIQDIFLKIWSKRLKLSSQYTVKAYLFTSLRNALLENLRKVQNRNRILDLYKIGMEVCFSLEFEILKSEHEHLIQKRLLEGMGKLTDRQREIIYLRYIQDLSIPEISQILNINHKGVYKLSARAIDSLKKNINVRGIEFIALLSSLKLIIKNI